MIVWISLVFALTLASGFWLSSAGKPLNTAIFNVHKLIALGAVVLAALEAARTLRGGAVEAVLILLMILAGIGVLALFATGALMSIGKLSYSLSRMVHIIATALVAAIAVLALVLV